MHFNFRFAKRTAVESRQLSLSVGCSENALIYVHMVKWYTRSVEDAVPYGVRVRLPLWTLPLIKLDACGERG